MLFEKFHVCSSVRYITYAAVATALHSVYLYAHLFTIISQEIQIYQIYIQNLFQGKQPFCELSHLILLVMQLKNYDSLVITIDIANYLLLFCRL